MKTILVVDDEPDVLLLMRVLVEVAGFNVVTAGDGVEALERLGQGGIDLVVTDVMMPRMDGEELVRHIRSDQALSSMPIVVVTARGGGVEGADIVMAKPFAGPDLVGAVNGLISRS